MKSCIGQGVGGGHKVSVPSLTVPPSKKNLMFSYLEALGTLFLFLFFSFF